MSPAVWPKVERVRLYDMSELPLAARTRTYDEARPVNEFGVGEAQHPRRSNGPAEDLPDGYIYWCLSCNRRVAHYNQPFCLLEHQAQREQYVRDLRIERAKPVKVKREDLHAIHESASRLLMLRGKLIAAVTPIEKDRAVRALFDAIRDFEHFVRTTVPTGEVVVALRPTPTARPRRRRPPHQP